ncbi:MAG: class I SAM-dependent methyltransferase [Ferrovibrio sp.]
MQIERNHFNQEAEHYPEEIGEAHAQAMKWELVARHSTPGMLAADVGAASGRHAIPLAKSGATVLALDLSIDMLAKLRQRGQSTGLSGNLFAAAAALPDLPLRARSFDLIYCFSTMLLLPHEQQQKALHCMASALRPGGSMIVDLAGGRSLALSYWHRFYRRLGFAGIHGWTLPEVHTLITQTGLSLKAIQPHGVLSQFLLLPGATRIPGLEALIRGNRDHAGLDARVSDLLPSLAERWYVVARRSETQRGEQE